MSGQVAELWGEPNNQFAPSFAVSWDEEVLVRKVRNGADGQPLRDALGETLTYVERSTNRMIQKLPIVKSDLRVGLTMDQRRKGLLWFSLYDVDFHGLWQVQLPTDRGGDVSVSFEFPSYEGLYDDFRVLLDGADITDQLKGGMRGVSAHLVAEPGQVVVFDVRYKSRGLDQWRYSPGETNEPLRDFSLAVSTDFAEIDFPERTMSPSTKSTTDGGWSLQWTFDRVVTGRGMGVSLPQRVQPGPLAASMSFSAPLSLALFMGWIYVIGLLRGLDIHPMNHFFLAAAFFAFHLLFGYSADHLPVEAAFGLSALVSVALVVSYLRLVVGTKFAWREAGFAQVLYLVGFMGAHFVDGFTGLTLTVLGIGTLFAVMQLTGDLKWTDVFSGKRLSERSNDVQAR